MNFDRARFVPPPPPKKIQVRVLLATFRVEGGRTPQVGEVVSLDDDVARSLAAVGKVSLIVH